MLRLKFARIERGLTQTELAERAGLGIVTVAQIDRGRVNPSPEELKKIGKVLGVPPERLMDHVVDPPFSHTHAALEA